MGGSLVPGNPGIPCRYIQPFSFQPQVRPRPPPEPSNNPSFLRRQESIFSSRYGNQRPGRAGRPIFPTTPHPCHSRHRSGIHLFFVACPSQTRLGTVACPYSPWRIVSVIPAQAGIHLFIPGAVTKDPDGRDAPYSQPHLAPVIPDTDLESIFSSLRRHHRPGQAQGPAPTAQGLSFPSFLRRQESIFLFPVREPKTRTGGTLHILNHTSPLSFQTPIWNPSLL